MPMCDAYIPKDVLEPEVEQQLIRRVSVLLAEHEMRRAVELMEDPAEVEAMRQKALSLAWTFVHHPDTYFAGEVAPMPIYKFVASIPEGQIDDEFRRVVVPDVVEAVAAAEDGRYPNPAMRTWVLIHEIPDGTWGASGRIAKLKDIVDYIAPGWGDDAVERFAGVRRKAAADLVALAESAPEANA